MKPGNKAFVLAFILAFLVWIMEAAIDTILFYEGTFLDVLIFAVPAHEAYIRTLIAIAFLFFGLLMRSTLNTVVKGVQEKNRSDREKELYFELISHDVKNEILSIYGVADAISQLDIESIEEIHGLNARIRSASKRMTRILDVITNPSKEWETSVLSLMKSAVGHAQSQHPGLTININSHEDIQILGSKLLPSVFENLFRNSVVYSGETAIVEISITSRDNYVQILVSDNGPGMPEEIKPKLFQRGTSTAGTGLGLYISREILKSIGGTIELVNSVPPQGATFKISIPTVE